MAPKLYQIAASPPVRAVLLCAKALGVELDLQEVNLLTGEHLQDEYLKLNPQHTVPTLEDDDGYVLWDSHAIMGYLVGKYGEDDSLYPKDDIKKRSTIDQRLHFDTGILFARGVLISRSIIFGGKTEIAAESITSMKEAYDFLEKFLDNNEYVAGDKLSIADFSIISTITSWNVFVPIEGNEHPNIKAWIEKVESLPYYAEANQPGLDQFAGLITSKLSS